MKPENLKYKITCHCGLASQTITSRRPAVPPEPAPSPARGGGGTHTHTHTHTTAPPSLDMCHCRTCRKTTGLLCASYLRIEAPPPQTAGLVAYRATTDRSERLFCGTCGCHVFWRGGEPGGERADDWAVATGVIEGYAAAEVRRGGTGGADGGAGGEDGESLLEPQYVRHINVSGTRDGGLSIYLPEIRGRAMDDKSSWGSPGDDDGDDVVPLETSTGDEDILPARCHCGNVSFHVTRPDESSSAPCRGYTDLMHPYCSTPPAIAANPEDEKWWLRLAPSAPSQLHSRPLAQQLPPQVRDQNGLERPTRYLAGTCACRPCRLISGFEIQSWAFVPRSNIFFHVPSFYSDTVSTTTATTVIPLDFDGTLSRRGILKSYQSSPGVVREFCARCGATVFWREQRGADVVDVSAGLFDAAEGARAESWLEWWTGRVSFAEEAGTGRSGEVAARAEGLIESLERGMRASAERR